MAMKIGQNEGSHGPLSKLKQGAFQKKASKKNVTRPSERENQIKTGSQKARDAMRPDVTRRGLSGSTVAIKNTMAETGKGANIKLRS